jgi:hypothetical protein
VEKCQFPGCRKKARKTWALVNLCCEHHEAINQETLQYYGQKAGAFHISYDERNYYMSIVHLIPWRRKAVTFIKRRKAKQ